LSWSIAKMLVDLIGSILDEVNLPVGQVMGSTIAVSTFFQGKSERWISSEDSIPMNRTRLVLFDLQGPAGIAWVGLSEQGLSGWDLYQSSMRSFMCSAWSALTQIFSEFG